MSPDDAIKARLLAGHLPVDDVELPAAGVTVRVRGLSRKEALSFDADADAAAYERRMVATAMVRPTMTEDEVAQWQASGPAGELKPVVRKINELSGAGEGTAKETWKEFESNPDAEFRALPGEGAGDDGGSAEG